MDTQKGGKPRLAGYHGLSIHKCVLVVGIESGNFGFSHMLHNGTVP